MNKQKLMELLEHPENLPELAYTTLPSDPTEVIMIVNGKRGYYPVWKSLTPRFAKEDVDYRNEIFGVSDEALTILSMKNN